METPTSAAADSAAEALESMVDRVRDQDWESILSEIQQIAKRYPGAVLVATAALGFLLARSIARR